MPQTDHALHITDHIQVTAVPNGYKVSAQFEVFIESARQENEPDQIEEQVEAIGQHFKRRLYAETLEAADQNAAELVQRTSDEWTKNGKKPFTFVARFGKVTIQRQQLRKKTLQ